MLTFVRNLVLPRYLRLHLYHICMTIILRLTRFLWLEIERLLRDAVVSASRVDN